MPSVTAPHDVVVKVHAASVNPIDVDMTGVWYIIYLAIETIWCRHCPIVLFDNLFNGIRNYSCSLFFNWNGEKALFYKPCWTCAVLSCALLYGNLCIVIMYTYFTEGYGKKVLSAYHWAQQLSKLGPSAALLAGRLYLHFLINNVLYSAYLFEHWIKTVCIYPQSCF